ncbi:MAG TPA: metalloregulator ArsR/SmtB family transcription factor [Myxococcota bacterium]|nr:metalloregulator ArsR/SmtB family transcription factor [Myxococcota bacterium]
MSLDATLAALSDPTRRAVLELLRGGPRRAGELSDALGMSPPAMSRHLRVLRECGLVAEARGDDDGRVRVLRLRPEPLDELRHWIGEVERFWTGQLASFKEHAERRSRRAPRRR